MKRVIGPLEVGEDPQSKVRRVISEAEGPAYAHQGPKPTPAQEAAYNQAAAAYAHFALQAENQAKHARDAAGYYMRMTRQGMRSIMMQITGGPTTAPVAAPDDKRPFEVCVQRPDRKGDTEARVCWCTPDECEDAGAEVFYGEDPKQLGYYATGEATQGENVGDRREHVVHIKNLTPGTRYFFKCGDSKYGFSKVYKFLTTGASAPQNKSKADPRERRIDPADGRAYTREEFFKAYHCFLQWDQAAPVAKPGDIRNHGPVLVLRGFRPRGPPSGIAQFFSQRLRARQPELGAGCVFTELSRGPDEVRLQPSGGVEAARQLCRLVNVAKDFNQAMYPDLMAELLGVTHAIEAPPVPVPAADAAGAEPSAKAATEEPKGDPDERRYDPKCPSGRIYTKDEFFRMYKSDREWDLAPKVGEKRIDPADGQEYDWPGFREQYKGSVTQWDAAFRPGGAPPPLVRLQGFGRRAPHGSCEFFARRLFAVMPECMSTPNQFGERECANEQEILLAPGSEAAADGLIKMVNDVRDFNTELFPDMKAVKEPDPEATNGTSGNNNHGGAE
eukprot:TRINITY_DN8558_c0_g1_i1.p1 TRINITY_DN8558_c0_g1~~TRINITY_DN8558_c0_g1_i1.p1  ORF type:complete len:559 (+),score=168.61 TRINITY_DN8558_c0_g1_i1:125-1801(+)